MELSLPKVELTSPHGNFINGTANPEIVYILLSFKMLSIDCFFFKKRRLL